MVVVIAATLVLSASVEHSSACTNYEDYLHWVGSMDFPSAVESIAVQGDYAYVLETKGATDSLVVVDITNGSSPVVVGTLKTPMNSHYLAVSGTVAAVSSAAPDTGGLHLIDISDPHNPTMIGTTYHGYQGQAIAMADTMVYMVWSHNPEWHLTITSVADPANPVAYPPVLLPEGAHNGLELRGDYAYVGAATLTTVNIADPDSAFVTDTHFADIRRITLSGDYLYASVNGVPCGLIGFRLSVSPEDPEPIFAVESPYPGGYYPFVAATNDICFYGDSTGSIWMFRITNREIPPPLIGYLPHSGHPLSGLLVHDHRLYCISSEYGDDLGFLNTFSVSSPDPMSPIGKIDTPGEALAVVVPSTRSGLAYVADGAFGVQVVDVADPENPFIVDWVDTPGHATDLVLVDSLAYVADGPEGLQVVNVNALGIIGAVDTPDSAVALTVVDTLAYVADRAGGLRIISVADPTMPLERGAQDTALLDTQSVDVSGTIAYVADGDQGVQAVDVSEPDDPWVIGGVKTREVQDARKIDVRFDRAYVTDANTGLVVLDVADPGDMEVVADVTTEDTPSDVDLLGIFAFVGTEEGMQLIDIQDDTSPEIVGVVELPRAARGVFANEAYAYVAVGDSGLQVCPTQCGFDELVAAGFTMDENAGLCPFPITFTNVSEGYGMSYTWDFGDGMGTSTEASPTYTYTEAGDYTVILTATNGINMDVATAAVEAQSESPTMKGVSDVPDDEGGYVYLDFYHSVYDTTGLDRMDLYTIQRRDNGQWVILNTIGAFGEHYYRALAPTLCDGLVCTTAFRIIAHMDPEGNFVSNPMVGFSFDDTQTGVPDVVTEMELDQAIPNPFNPATTIGYAVPAPCHVRFRIYDVAGRLVRTLVDAERPPGRHQATWMGRDDDGHAVASGVYFYELKAGEGTLRRTMTLLK